MIAAQDHRRGWCPGILRPMATGDGLLVRLHPPGGVLTASQAEAIAAGAARHGNGLVDVTARGNLQIRGVSERTHPPLAVMLAAAGLADGARAAGPFRLVVTSPFAGIDPTDTIDALALAAAIEAACLSLPELPPKTCVSLDGGGLVALDGVGADIRLNAVGGRVALFLAAPDAPVFPGTLAVSDVPGAVSLILARFAAWSGSSRAGRLRDASPELRAALIAGLPFGPAALPPPRAASPRAGFVSTGGLNALLLALPYGRCPAEALARIAGWSRDHGRGEVRAAPGRALAIPGVASSKAPALLREAAGLGLIVDRHDPRLSVSACPGAPACASGRTAARADADGFALAGRALLAGGLSLHVSGCPKGCAHPAPAGLTLVGSDGAYAVVLDGSAGDKPVAHLRPDELIEILRGASSGAGLASLFTKPNP